jgi:hypothetical protein
MEKYKWQLQYGVQGNGNSVVSEQLYDSVLSTVDISAFVNSYDEMYLNTRMKLTVWLSNPKFYSTQWEYTQDNNNKGFTVDITPEYISTGNWRRGINFVEVPAGAFKYLANVELDWRNHRRVEIYLNDFKKSNDNVCTPDFIVFMDVRFERSVQGCTGATKCTNNYIPGLIDNDNNSATVP